MNVDIVAVTIFVLGLSFWTGVLHNKVCNLTKRLDKNDSTTDKVPELMVQVAAMSDILKEIKTDIHDLRNDISSLKVDLEAVKK